MFISGLIHFFGTICTGTLQMGSYIGIRNTATMVIDSVGKAETPTYTIGKWSPFALNNRQNAYLNMSCKTTSPMFMGACFLTNHLTVPHCIIEKGTKIFYKCKTITLTTNLEVVVSRNAIRWTLNNNDLILHKNYRVRCTCEEYKGEIEVLAKNIILPEDYKMVYEFVDNTSKAYFIVAQEGVTYTLIPDDNLKVDDGKAEESSEFIQI